jgi:hypothetical protein
MSARLPISPASRLRWALCAIVVLAGCGREPTYWRIHGRIEAPPGVGIENAVVMAWREDSALAFGSSPPGVSPLTMGADGSFNYYARDGERLDLQVDAPTSIMVGPPPPPSPPRRMDEVEAEFEAGLERDGPHRSIAGVGAYEGFVRGVRAGGPDAVIRLKPRVTKHVSVHVTDSDGAPVARSDVTFRFMGDSIDALTDAAGQINLDEVPVLDWSVVATPPGRVSREYVPARTRWTPGDDRLELALRRGVHIRVRMGSEPRGETMLMVNAAGAYTMRVWPWNPDAAGESVILAEPDWPSVTITAFRITQRAVGFGEGPTLGRATVNVAEGAIADLAAHP